MNTAILIISATSLVVSVTTLTVVLVGGKKATDELELIRSKTNSSLRKMRAALSELEL